MSEEKPAEKKKTMPQEIILRSYPKVIFFYPLLFTSAILWLIQAFFSEPVAGLGYFWMIVFFANLWVIAFDFSSSKFFILVLAIVVIVLLLIFFLLPNLTVEDSGVEPFNIGITAEFYMVMTIILAVILGLVVLGAQFDYWKVERNEIYHKKGLFSQAERWPVRSLRIKKEIPDVFEFFALRAGSITLIPSKDTIIPLHTVLNINKKAEQIDYLLSHLHVEVDQID